MDVQTPSRVRLGLSVFLLAGVLCGVRAWSAQGPIVGDINVAPGDTPLAGETVTLSVAAYSPDGLPLTYSWDFNDGTTGTGASVQHVFVASGVYIVTAEVSDGVNPPVGDAGGGIFVEALDPPPPGAADGVDSGDVKRNPDNGLSVTVNTDRGGFVGLVIDISALAGAGPAAARMTLGCRTDWGLGTDIPDAAGTEVRHKYDKQGIVVATTTVTDKDSGSEVGKVRKALVMDATGLGQPLGNVTAPPPPDKREMAVTKMKGKFNFKDVSKRDVVNLTYTLELPEGLDPKQPHDLTLSVGNVTETVTVNEKGRGLGTSFFRKVSVKYPRLARGQTVTTAGQTAAITLQMMSANMSAAGFDTEGITARVKAAGVLPRIQVAMLVEGVGYSNDAEVEYKLSTKGDTGAFKLPSRQ